MGEVGMEVQKRAQTRAVHVVIIGIIRYILHPYCFSSNGISVKSSRDVRCTLLPYNCEPQLVHILFCTAIPTSPINFIQLFFLCLSLQRQQILTVSVQWCLIFVQYVHGLMVAHIAHCELKQLLLSCNKGCALRVIRSLICVLQTNSVNAHSACS